jgi:nudix-type nucleoside diphosphatase (YffH/AdpP family)
VRILDQKTVYSGWGRMLLVDIEFDDGRRAQRQLEDHGEAAAVLPYDAERCVALVVRQGRVAPLYWGLDGRLIEAAAGIIDPGEDGPGTAVREAMEELGVRLGALEPVVLSFTMCGLSSERIHLYLAPYTAGDRVAEGGGDEGEEIEVLELPLKELLAQADAGELPDMKTLTLLLALQRRRPELFV